MKDGHILTLSCPDRPGIVHAVSGFLLDQGGNILEAGQFDDRDTGLFFMRVHFTAPKADFAAAFGPVAERFEKKTSVSGGPYFVLKATDGQIVGTSEMYSGEAARDNGIASVKANSPSTEVKDLTAG